MAELTPRERFQPSLLDRLTDDAPENRQDRREQRTLTMPQLRASVLRDLGWLLNTPRRFRPEELADFPQVPSSVVNYGVPDLCGSTASSVVPQQVERQMLEAVQRFEPRVLKRGLSLRAAVDERTMAPNALAFEIKGEMWAQPLPERLYVRTDLDLETGQFSMREGGGGNG